MTHSGSLISHFWAISDSLVAPLSFLRSPIDSAPQKTPPGEVSAFSLHHSSQNHLCTSPLPPVVVLCNFHRILGWSRDLEARELGCYSTKPPPRHQKLDCLYLSNPWTKYSETRHTCSAHSHLFVSPAASRSDHCIFGNCTFFVAHFNTKNSINLRQPISRLPVIQIT